MTLFAFFVPVPPQNLKNMRGRWNIERYSRQMRGMTALMGTRALRETFPSGAVFLTTHPEHPKQITLTAYLRRRFDSQDGLRAACAPVVDGLQPRRAIAITKGARAGGVNILAGCGIIDHDGPGCGHTFSYQQEVRQKELGIRVEVAW